MKEAINAINAAIEAAKALPRSREASIAITELETALLWVERLQRMMADAAE